MTKSKTLKIEIDNAIEKIKLLSTNEKLEVYNIFSNVYKLYLNLPKEDFINDFYCLSKCIGCVYIYHYAFKICLF